MTPQTATAMQPAKASVTVKQGANDNVFDRMQQAYDVIERRAFELFDNNGRWFGHDLADWFQAESEILHPVHLEIAETQDALSVHAEVPGYTAKELDIQVDGNRLTIAGKHESKEETKKGKTIYSERCANEILRSIELPTSVDTAKVSATLKDGVLSVELPKTAHSRSVRIEPKALT